MLLILEAIELMNQYTRLKGRVCSHVEAEARIQTRDDVAGRV